MNKNFSVRGIFNSRVIFFTAFLICVFSYPGYPNIIENSSAKISLPVSLFENHKIDEIYYQYMDINYFFKKLETFYIENDLTNIKIYADSLQEAINFFSVSDTLLLIKSYYLLGASMVDLGNESQSFGYFQKALQLLDKKPEDNIKGRIFYFLGYTYNKIGDHLKSSEYFSKSLELKKKVFGENSPELLPDYVSLSISKINLRDYKNAVDIVNEGLFITNNMGFNLETEDIALLYQNKGVALSMIAEYKKAIINLLKAKDIYESLGLPVNANMLNLINNIATSYFYLKDTARCIQYFEKGYEMAYTMNDLSSYNFVSFMSNYAMFLGNINQKEKGKEILLRTIERIKSRHPKTSREYCEILNYYASYLLRFKIDFPQSLEIFRTCYEYVYTHPWDVNLNTQIARGYALALMNNGKVTEALDSITMVLYRSADLKPQDNPLINPDIQSLKKDITTWDLLRAKYLIQQRLYSLTGDFNILKSCAEISDFMVKILEDLRLNLGDEESRLLLGERFRDSYMFAIESYNQCYELTNEAQYLLKVFEYSEKSKAASLLTYTREAKAMRYHIPPSLVTLEHNLSLEIGFYESKIEAERNSSNPDRSKIELWTENLINAQNRKDSLLKVFEKDFPDYYKMKYDTRVVSPEMIPELAGKKANYLSYIVNDTLLHIIVVNNKYLKIKTLKIDDSFFNTVNTFRQLLSDPVKERNAKDAFLQFQENGFRLYSFLLKPVEEYLISEYLVISPDGKLSFFPFDIMIMSEKRDTSLYYNILDYVTKKYDISYTYSATLLSETRRRMPSFFNNAVTFAPSYDNLIVDSVSRSENYNDLPPLVYAQQEASYVSKLIPGKLFMNEKATLENYKAEAGKFDVVHLAMHTIVDGASPANSGMIFYNATVDSAEDVYLKPYEVYGIPLNAKMVVLSSCFTGTGTLYAGEGVLSLARGFIVSGSKSVVMSLWEIDDMAGASIIKSYYKNLKSGMRKSRALKKARMDYLERADMRLSHPYYWSTLVIYGDDSPLYISWYIKTVLLVVLSLVLIITIRYFKKR